MNAKHTPGPYQVGHRGTQVYGPDNRLLASCGAITGRPLHVQVANARYFTLAPAMEDMLRRLIKSDPDYRSSPAWQLEIENLLKLVDGEEESC